MMHASLLYAVLCLLCLIRHAVTSLSNLTLPEVAPSPGLDTPPSPSVQHGLPPIETLADSLLFVSTLDGALSAVSRATGRPLWTLREQPVLKTPVNLNRSPMFLTNPRDGSLYTFGGVGYDDLKKLPFTLPDLVTAAPCRSSDGTLYTGYKRDTWFAIDPLTGRKTLDTDGVGGVCPSASSSTEALFIGRTEYTLAMFDGATRALRWNATFLDYSAHAAPSPTTASPPTVLRHFASTSGGAVVTLEEGGGAGGVLWTRDYGSPVVAMYSLDSVGGGGLARIPFVSVAGETLELLTGRVTSTEWRQRLLELGGDRESLGGDRGFPGGSDGGLFATLYIGERETCFYALPALVDRATVTIVPRHYRPLLIEGPLGERGSGEGAVASDEDVTGDGEKGFLMLGYHEEPEIAESLGFNVARRQIADKSGGVGALTPPAFIPPSENPSNLTLNTPFNNSSSGISGEVKGWVITEQTFAALGTTLFLIAAGLLYALRGRPLPPRPAAPCCPAGWVTVGALSYDPGAVLGHGSGGTSVYHGVFDGGREVAVKRVLPRSASLAAREVELLRQSDPHPHVVRYLLTERDHNFMYIALELCATTLHDYVEGRRAARGGRIVRAPRGVGALEGVGMRRGVVALRGGEALRDVGAGQGDGGSEGERGVEEEGGLDGERTEGEGCESEEKEGVRLVCETMKGLAHLHLLGIVHRDVKPSNVLLSRPDSHGVIHAMISDFGLCKKLPLDSHSLSKSSGTTGTEGWIAPEMLCVPDEPRPRTTCAVDIFSAGCVAYYTLTLGLHPFGSALSRQANILEGRCPDLGGLSPEQNRQALGIDLVGAMTSHDPLDRLTAPSVLKHPLFWDAERELTFFEAVSDRVEKLSDTDAAVLRLESGGLRVVRTDWTQHISAELREDLRRHRSYRVHSVRDLLRALRNKRHHLRELSAPLRTQLGDTLERFSAYFTSRFPRLLAHAYDAMRACADEKEFSPFY